MQVAAETPKLETKTQVGSVSMESDQFSLQMRVFFVRSSNSSNMHAASQKSAATRPGGWARLLFQ